MTRGAPLEPVATVETERRRVRLIDGASRAVAEVDDDWVVAMGADGRSSRFREIEVEAARMGGLTLPQAIPPRAVS